MTGKAPVRWTFLVSALFLNALFIIGAFDPSPHTGGDNAGYVSLAYSLVTTGSYTEPVSYTHLTLPTILLV